MINKILEVNNLKKHFPVKNSKFFSKQEFVKALDGVSFSINKGEIVGLVGESGCGKTTLARTIMRLEEPTQGDFFINNKDISKLKGSELKKYRSNFQMIFQDPYSSLNSKITIENVFKEILSIHSDLSKNDIDDKIDQLLLMVGLNPEQKMRYPHQFSGGQRQRIGIARALAVNPEFIIADEPVSALDVSVQAQIINLLKEIQKKKNIAFLFIAHDLAVVRHISDRIIVMYLGKIVEEGTADDICKNPLHPYTKALISSIPSAKQNKIILKGDIPSPLNPPAGCAFHTRCPEAKEECKIDTPELNNINDKRKVACLFVKENNNK